MIKTFEEARRYIHQVQICTISATKKSELPSLWDQIDLPEKRPGEKGWGQKISAVWDWKNRLPATYPDEIFYGKVKGGFAALMTIDYLRNTYFSDAYKPIEAHNAVAIATFNRIYSEPWETTNLREEMVDAFGCSKSQFDTALKNLQISLNVVRSNDPGIERDTWLTFEEQYPDIWRKHVPA